MTDRPKLRGVSSSFDMPDPDDDLGPVDELEVPSGTAVPATAWFATAWCAIVVGLLGVAALWVLAVTAVTR